MKVVKVVIRLFNYSSLSRARGSFESEVKIKDLTRNLNGQITTFTTLTTRITTQKRHQRQISQRPWRQDLGQMGGRNHRRARAGLWPAVALLAGAGRKAASIRSPTWLPKSAATRIRAASSLRPGTRPRLTRWRLPACHCLFQFYVAKAGSPVRSISARLTVSRRRSAGGQHRSGQPAQLPVGPQHPAPSRGKRTLFSTLVLVSPRKDCCAALSARSSVPRARSEAACALIGVGGHSRG